MAPPELKKVSDTVWEIPKTFKQGMHVPARIYATEKLVKEMDDGVYNQVTNVACLPGILKYAYCMPDGHWGYGFPIGGVAAFDVEKGIISPGGIGFDINCGMRLLTTNLTLKDVRPRIKELVDNLFQRVPAGVGSTGFVKLNRQQFREITETGARWCIEQGYGWEEDLKMTEEDGVMKGADASKVSDRAIKRGMEQIGTLGSGNHYLEIQYAKDINDAETAKAFGITETEQIVIMFHCGSRGFGHQIGTDYLQTFLNVMPKYGIKVLDRELACAPFRSREGQDYFAAMQCGINMSFANRQVILHRIREVFSKVFGRSAEDMGMHQVYDVAHNTAKLEKHKLDGQTKEVLVHRKGSTRAFGPGREEVPEKYRSVGQPIIIGGSMETGSYLLAGTSKAMEETFGSTCHGSGRTMSRARAKQLYRGDRLIQDMAKRGIYVKSVSMSGVAEEAGGAYKDIDEVINAVHQAGISKKVVKLAPIGNVKG
ncbi:MAG: RtcB family protein [Candidatus Aenigmarchaeota archaeon]|nr:RtcB family protein [Candidatus Aenigmarchaeota archaeon]